MNQHFDWQLRPLPWQHRSQRLRADACIALLHAAGVLTDAERDECGMSSECLHCEHDLDEQLPRRGKPGSWRCPRCGRAGDYARMLTRDGKVVTARIEREPGQPKHARPWVLAESVPYAARVAS